MMDAIDALYNYLPDYDKIEKILIDHHADEEAEDIFEGMEDNDIQQAYKEVRDLLKSKIMEDQKKWMSDEKARKIIDMFEIKFIADSMSKFVNKSELDRKLRRILKEYLLSQGFDEDEINRWLVIDIQDFTDADGDIGVHVQIRNDLIGYYDLSEEVMNKLDKVVEPGYFEPYYETVWDAYIWDKKLKSSVEDEDIEDKEDSNKLMTVLRECQEILKRALVEEGYSEEELEEAGIQVHHELDEGKDIIILSGHQDWSGSKLEEDVVNEIEDLLLREYGNCDFKWFDNSAGGIFRFEEARHMDDSVYSHLIFKIRNARSMPELDEAQDLLLQYEENGLVGPNTADELWHEVDLKIDELRK